MFAIVYHHSILHCSTTTEVVDADTVRMMPEHWGILSWHDTHAEATAALHKHAEDCGAVVLDGLMIETADMQ